MFQQDPVQRSVVPASLRTSIYVLLPAVCSQAILSTTAKARDRAKKKAETKAKAEGGAPTGKEADGPTAMDTDAGAKEGGEPSAAAAKKDEPSSFEIQNPARVVPAQVRRDSKGQQGQQ